MTGWWSSGPAAVAVVVVVFVGYYAVGKGLLLRWARRCAERTTSWGLDRPVLEKAALYELVLVVASHVVLVVALLAWRGFDLPGLGVTPTTVVLAPLGVLLGVAQMVTSIFACQVLIAGIGARVPQQAGPGRTTPLSPQAWTDYSRAGWMRHHLVASAVLPRAVSIPLTTLQVTCEEIVFRGVFPLAVASAVGSATVGPVVGQWVSAALFIVMQTFFMPNWRSAMFPVVGSALMAATHGYLYVATGELWPLVIAHAVSFFAAARTGQK